MILWSVLDFTSFLFNYFCILIHLLTIKFINLSFKNYTFSSNCWICRDIPTSFPILFIFLKKETAGMISSGKAKKSEEIGGVEDLVEDFELSSDGGEESE